MEGYAEYYSADLSEKVVRGMTENALKSKYNGGTRPIGYLIDSDQYFQLDPLTAPFVREAFQRYDEGATMTAIRDWLNEQGVKNTRGQKMTYNSVQHLLNNRRYIGEYTYRDIVVPDGIPAIVPQDLFDRVQEKLAKNKKAPARHKAEDDYLLTTKLFCGYCGAYLCGESGTSHTGNVHHYYKCVSVKKKRTECHKKSVRKEWIEDLVVSETMKMVMDDEAIEAIVSMLMDLQDRENVNLPLYEQQLREADTAIQNLLTAIQQGILTKSTKGRLKELEATKEELETKIACEKMAKPKVSSEFMTFWLHRFRKLDVRQKSHRKMLIDIFINAIFLYDDKMVITFNYKEGATTIILMISKPHWPIRKQVRIWIAQLHQKERHDESRVFLFGFRSRWSLHPSVLKCSGSAKPPLRNSSVLGTSEFTAHKRRWPEGRFGISMEQHSVSLLTPASLLLLPKSQPLRWVVIWCRRFAAFFDFAEISVLTVPSTSEQSPLCGVFVLFRENIGFNCPLQKERHDRRPCLSFWVPLPLVAPPFGISMLGASKLPLRQGFRRKRKHLYVALAPPVRRPVGRQEIKKPPG